MKNKTLFIGETYATLLISAQYAILAKLYSSDHQLL